MANPHSGSGSGRRRPPTEAARVRKVWAPLTDVRHGQCRWAGCARPTDTFVRNDKTVLTESLYCRDHSCLMFGDDDVLCRFPNSPFSSFCDDHMRCVARLGEGVRCQQLVRERRPGLYRFCAELHGCVEAGCSNERERRGARGEDLQRCRDHRCGAEACPGPRRANGHCEAHTCASPDCRAVVRGPGAPPDDAAPECRNPRAAAPPGDGAGPGPYCGQHECAQPACRAQRVRGPRCPDHRPCARAGSASFVDADGGGNVCPEHRRGRCRFAERAGGLAAACARPAEPDAAHCAVHLCAVRGCVAGRLGAAAAYCRAHAGADALFCAAHECRRRDCRDRVVADEGLCVAHARRDGPEPPPGPGEGHVGQDPDPAPGGECVAM